MLFKLLGLSRSPAFKFFRNTFRDIQNVDTARTYHILYRLPQLVDLVTVQKLSNPVEERDFTSLVATSFCRVAVKKMEKSDNNLQFSRELVECNLYLAACLVEFCSRKPISFRKNPVGL